VEVVTAKELSTESLEGVQRIFEDAFDARLRSSFDNLLADQVYVLLDGDEPQGFAVLRVLGPTPWIFLRYYAVGRRGLGLGSRFWKLLTQRLAAEGHTRIIWDVEHPAEPGAEDVEIRERRIVFYTRLGGNVLPVKDFRWPDGDTELPMVLMAAELTSTPEREPAAPVVGEDLRQVVKAVYRYRYGFDEQDPVVQSTLAASGL
jgi:hypothetical protein